MNILSMFLIAIAFIILIPGMLYLTESAPQQAVVVGLACFLGICSRISQAVAQHKELKKILSVTNKDNIEQ